MMTENLRDWTADELRDAIQTELRILGDSADEIAESLRVRGVKGAPGNCAFCPLARFIDGLPFGLRTLVKHAGVEVWGDDVPALSFGLSPACAEFIRRMDMCFYPFLSCDPTGYDEDDDDDQGGDGGLLGAQADSLGEGVIW